MADAALAALQATALTARCHNTFFRQKQLKCLHDALRSDNEAIKDAIKQDSRVSDLDAVAEVALALNIIKGHYSAIDPEKELNLEYRIARGEDAADAREPVGVVYIESLQNHTPFFSTITALSTALAAGNCVALKLENNLRAVPSILRKLLAESLEPDTFAIISSDPSSASLSQCLQVLQDRQPEEQLLNHLVSSKRKVIAIVDRSTDIAAAAEQLITARFAFGGTSPYAPDVIFVNEFVKKDFLEVAMKHAFRFMAHNSELTNGSIKSSASSKSKNIADAHEALSKSSSWKLSTFTQGDSGAIVEITNPSALPPKQLYAVLPITAITSLEHAINLVESNDEQLLAAYYFTTPEAGKYLAQFIPGDASFINHVPYSLLLGPAAPEFHPSSRYVVSQFSRPSPAFIRAPASQPTMNELLNGKDTRAVAMELLVDATSAIREPKRKESIAIGFFEKGILIGLGVYGIPLLTCIGASLFFGVRAGLRRWALI